MDILEGLNAEQRSAVMATEGYVRLIAGAGSGKTRALAHRFAYLVDGVGILPAHILCVTFTNKAANEMRQRIHLLTGDNDTGYVCTSTAFASPFCRRTAMLCSIQRISSCWIIRISTLCSRSSMKNAASHFGT